MIGRWISERMFNFVHQNQLIYNTCWEDPRLDREALGLGPGDDIVMITSAGCNALDYALCDVRSVHAVDMNPRQNALLELKLAAIRRLPNDEVFSMFGRGYLPTAVEAYRDSMRTDLSNFARGYWDRYIKFFANPDRSFYFRGSSGAFAWLINKYIDRVAKARGSVDRMLNAETLEQQRDEYQTHVFPQIWKRPVRMAMGRDSTLSMLGVPRAQRRQVERDFGGGIAGFIEHSLDHVFARLPLSDNYFWRVYLTGQYSPTCCPEYLKPANLDRLRGGLVDRVNVHTTTLTDFLNQTSVQPSRFVLLDHMDWMSEHRHAALVEEWQQIADRARPGARLIWRSGGLRTDYLNDIQVDHRGRKTRVPDLLSMQTDLASRLHQQDRVGTYGSFFIGHLAG
ncbi:DUF3419 family protein [Rosistilla oblonga]|uniref:S-adenosylmethionine:diacylglycerol 3-amino-3-carboxypropyl transferase n=1 Tax=Rosistilla oblonga TaxID=2527990 RepID=A0A518IR71_9BACT|nr:BtaA family protein [Rosistilla oblonga]QDV55588.1 hypothetical protein Mal33_15650 [Rosistilla oblonga]